MGASPGAGAGCDCGESRHPSRAAARTAPRDTPDGLSETQSSNPHRPTRGHVCMLSCTDKSPIRGGWPGRGKNRNLVQCTSDALDRAGRDDSALSDIYLSARVPRATWWKREQISLWGSWCPTPRERLPADGRDRKSGESRELSDKGNCTVAPPRAVSSQSGKCFPDHAWD